MHRLKGDIPEIGSAAISLVDVLDQKIDEQFGGIELIRQLCGRAVFEPWRVLVVRHVGLGGLVVGAGSVECE